MDRTPVSSSNIASIGYEDGTLEIAFLRGSGVYQYYGVPESVYRDFMSASSKGNYFTRCIRGCYREKKVEWV